MSVRAAFGLALTVQGILKMLLIGLSLATAYTLIVLMTMYLPGLCRRSSASWTLAVTMLSLLGWLLAPPFPLRRSLGWRSGPPSRHHRLRHRRWTP